MTYTGHTRVPVVEGGELINKIHKSGDLVLGVVTHDLLGGTQSGDGRVHAHLALDEALQARLQGAIGNGLVVGGVGAVHLKVDTSHRVVRVVDNGVVVLVLAVPLLAVGLIDQLGVPERTAVDNVVQAILVNTTEDVVESAVLQQDPNNILNLVLQVGNGLLGAGLVAPGLGGATGGDSSAKGSTRKAEKRDDSVGLHD